MRVILAAILTTALSVFGLVLAQPTQLDEAWEQATREAVHRVAPSVVQIVTNLGLETIPVAGKPGGKPGAKPITGSFLLRGQGPTTGLILTSDGYIITSSFNFAHIPAEIQPTILVRIPGRGEPLPGRIVARDETRMLTLLKVEATGLPVPTFVPVKEIRVGQWALALGRTFSEDPNAPPSVSVGIVSALNRIWGKAIQTDAKVSPVNYGGPLIDIRGRVMGVLVPMSPRGDSELAGVEWYDSGIGFAVPLEDIYRVLPRLQKGENLRPGQLGVVFEQPPPVIGLDPTKPGVQGGMFGECRIGRILPGSAAARAGLQPGDVIIEADGQPVRWQLQLRHVLGPKYDFDTVSLKVRRGDKVLEFPKIPLTTPQESPRPAFAGLLPLRDDPRPGVVIRYVFPKSPAEAAGLRPGDHLVRLDGTYLRDYGQLRNLLAGFRPGSEVQLVIIRETQKAEPQLLPVTLKLGEFSSDVPEQLPPASSKQGLAPRLLYTKNILAGKPPFFELPKGAKPLPEPPGKPGLFRQRDAASGRESWLYVPDSYTPNIAHGLLIWLHPTGDTMEETIRKVWEPICKSHHWILYAPKAVNPGGWLASDSDAIVQDVRQLAQQYRLDPHRVVAHGLGNGASFALYLALDARELVRGAVLVGGSLATRIPDYDPGQPLAVFCVAGGRDPNIETVRNLPRELQRRHYPCIFRELPEHGTGYIPDPRLLEEIVRWLDSLDRF
jgi:serine protease Do